MTFYICDFILVDRELSINFLGDPSRRQVGQPWRSTFFKKTGS